MSHTDADLVALARSGDADAYRALVERYQPMVRSLALRLTDQPSTAEDLVQEALLQAWSSLGGLRDGARFRSWLYGVVLNVGRNWRRRPLIVPLPLDGWDGVVDPYDTLEVRWVVQQAVWELSPGNRAALLLFYYDDLSLEEVAGRLEVSLVAVKSRLHKGRRQLRQRLGAAWPELARHHPSIQRRQTMTELRIAKVVPMVPRVLVVLLDEPGQRVLPLWLRPQEAQAVVGSIELAANLLQATGTTVRTVRVEQLGDELFATQVLLGGPAGDRTVTARLADGLALAHRHASPILVGDEVIARLGLSLGEHGSLERVVEVAAGRAGIPLPATRPDAERVAEPRNLRFAEGLRHWDLRGSFLHDMSGAHWQDYACGSGDQGGWLEARVPEPLGFADLRQGILADAYRGGRVRLTADVKTADVRQQAGLYLRVIDPDRSKRPEDRQQATLRGTHDWTHEQVEADVGDGGVFVLFGISLTGPGQVQMRNVELSRV
jgi:RNA polymerase sigma factor (sigma-70 family)